MVLTTVLLVEVAELSTLPEAVVMGTSLPTSSVATWLSITTREGLESILTSVTACRASRIMFGASSGPSSKLNPGKARLSAAPTRPAAFTDGWPGGDAGMLDTDPVAVDRKACTP